jgi:hypothetical protein
MSGESFLVLEEALLQRPTYLISFMLKLSEFNGLSGFPDSNQNLGVTSLCNAVHN